jgi:hypothetical protein
VTVPRLAGFNCRHVDYYFKLIRLTCGGAAVLSIAPIFSLLNGSEASSSLWPYYVYIWWWPRNEIWIDSVIQPSVFVIHRWEGDCMEGKSPKVWLRSKDLKCYTSTWSKQRSLQSHVTDKSNLRMRILLSDYGLINYDWGGILGGNPDRSLKSFPPCYSQTPLLTDFTPQLLFFGLEISTSNSWEGGGRFLG